ncbi:MAG: ribosomal-processing cysteine protease Prp [Ruminococcus sp.]|uniref:ribosomal-processing cysteine protease Prp n=1 Tax=Ruminococcus sp. TaxID=41978 RepID=UPI0025E6AA21|nr:ribosomal-processing cysteine protease Prp [Ruminococcus sp.]MCR5541270.1 ribosomal-processing cysteine protease Prp [Ruminococcus sp.]
MIAADFFKNESDMLTGFRVSGHAGLADLGFDVCCASVSSAVMMAANTITEAFRLEADVEVGENEIKLSMKKPDENADKVLMGLLIHLYNLKDEFPGHIKLKVG